MVRRLFSKRVAVVVGVIVATLLAFDGVAAASTGPLVVGGIGADVGKWMIDAGLAVFDNTIGVMAHVYEPNLSSPYFVGQFEVARQVGKFVIVPFLMVATVSALFRGGLREVIHTYVVFIPVAIVGAVVAVAVVQLAQAIDNNFTDAIIESGKDDFLAFRNSIAALGGPDGLVQVASLGIVYMVLFFMMIFGLFFLWCELILRELAIYMALLFLPIAFGVAAWQGTRRWVVTLMEIVLVMIFSKFLIMATLTFGFSYLTGTFIGLADTPGAADTWARLGGLVGGLIVIFMAVFAMPTLIAFVLNPSFSMLGRREFFQQTPVNSDRQYARARMADNAKGMLGMKKK